jgi:small-conductance mechanosensitive channel
MRNRCEQSNVGWVFGLALIGAALVGFGFFSLLLTAQWLIVVATVAFSVVVAVTIVFALAIPSRGRRSERHAR